VPINFDQDLAKAEVLINVISKLYIPQPWMQTSTQGCVEMFTVEVKVGLKKGVSDPEGANTHKSLELLGFDEVKEVKSLKVYRMEVDAKSENEVRDRIEEMCKRILTNPVIHTHEITFL
jgi:phosphoribosylformylglycinamidine synthase